MLISPNDLVAGDIIISVNEGEMHDKIAKATSFEYSHCAVVVEQGTIVHATSEVIVSEPVGDYLADMPYHAAFRCYPPLQASEVAIVNRYAADSEGKKFDIRSALTQPEQYESHVLSLQGKVATGEYPEAIENPEAFFCSQFVATCLLKPREDSLAVRLLLNPKALSPRKVAEEPLFGLLLGFLEGKEVPDLAHDTCATDPMIPKHPDYRHST